jgi:hypothetical protein
MTGDAGEILVRWCSGFERATAETPLNRNIFRLLQHPTPDRSRVTSSDDVVLAVLTAFRYKWCRNIPE